MVVDLSPEWNSFKIELKNKKSIWQVSHKKLLNYFMNAQNPDENFKKDTITEFCFQLAFPTMTLKYLREKFPNSGFSQLYFYINPIDITNGVVDLNDLESVISYLENKESLKMYALFLNNNSSSNYEDVGRLLSLLNVNSTLKEEINSNLKGSLEVLRAYVDIPKLYTEDVKLIIRGKYSRISTKAKNRILQDRSSNTMKMVLERNSILRKNLETSLDIELSEDSEVYTIPTLKVLIEEPIKNL